MKYELKPLDSGGMINESIAILMNDFKSIIIVPLFFSILYYLIWGSNFSFLIDLIYHPKSWEELAAVNTTETNNFSLYFSILFISIQTVFIVRLVFSRYEGKHCSLNEVLRGSGRVIPVTIALNYICSVPYLVPIPFLAIVGIFVSIVFIFVEYIAIIEGKGIIPSLQRSLELTKGRRPAILGYIILFGFCFGIVSLLPVFAALFYHHILHRQAPEILMMALDCLSSAISYSLQIIAYLLVYFKVRMEKEHFSLEILADSFGSTDPESEIF